MALRRKLAWVAGFYFAEGLPFGLMIDNLPVYFRVHGVSLAEIGLLSLLGLDQGCLGVLEAGRSLLLGRLGAVDPALGDPDLFVIDPSVGLRDPANVGQ